MYIKKLFAAFSVDTQLHREHPDARQPDRGGRCSGELQLRALQAVREPADRVRR